MPNNFNMKAELENEYKGMDSYKNRVVVTDEHGNTVKVKWINGPPYLQYFRYDPDGVLLHDNSDRESQD